MVSERAVFPFYKSGVSAPKRTQPSNRNLCVSLLITTLALKEHEKVSLRVICSVDLLSSGFRGTEKQLQAGKPMSSNPDDAVLCCGVCLYNLWCTFERQGDTARALLCVVGFCPVR